MMVIDIGYGEANVHAQRPDALLLKSYAPEETFESQASANPTWWYELAIGSYREKESTGQARYIH
jgi:hypothetical protein